MRHHKANTTRLGYVGFSNQEVSQDTSRSELKSNDSMTVGVLDWEDIWFDTDTTAASYPTKFELIAEYTA
jgi:hypothetical protein